MATTTIGLRYPVSGSSNNVPTDMQNLATDCDAFITASYTTVQIAAFSAAEKWTGRRVYNSTKGCYQWYDGSAFIDEQGLVINTQAGAYSLVLTDANSKLVKATSATAVDLTVPTNASVAFPTGTTINVVQYGAGQVTIVPAGGVTVNATPGLKLRAQYSTATLIKMGTDEWLVSGDLTA